MPNWVYTTLKIRGSEEDLQTLKHFMLVGLTETDIKEGVVLHENALIPYPEKFAGEGYQHGGYNWCIQNWGSKWGFCETKLEEESSKRLYYTFNTAWSPVLPLIRKMAQLFPKLKFRMTYEDEGGGFSGIFTIQDHKEKDRAKSGRLR